MLRQVATTIIHMVMHMLEFISCGQVAPVTANFRPHVIRIVTDHMSLATVQRTCDFPGQVMQRMDYTNLKFSTSYREIRSRRKGVEANSSPNQVTTGQLMHLQT